MIYKELGEEIKLGIIAGIKQLEKEYGFDAFRMVSNKYIYAVRESAKIKAEIADKELELLTLKNKQNR